MSSDFSSFCAKIYEICRFPPLKETCSSTLRSQRLRVGKSLFFSGRANYKRRNCSVTELNVFDGADGCLPRDRAGGRGVGGARGSTAGIKKWSFSFIRLRSQRACWKKRATFIDTLRSFATEFDATVSPVALHKPRPRQHLPATPRHQLQRLRSVEFHVSLR